MLACRKVAPEPSQPGSRSAQGGTGDRQRRETSSRAVYRRESAGLTRTVRVLFECGALRATKEALALSTITTPPMNAATDVCAGSGDDERNPADDPDEDRKPEQMTVDAYCEFAASPRDRSHPSCSSPVLDRGRRDGYVPAESQEDPGTINRIVLSIPLGSVPHTVIGVSSESGITRAR